LFGIKIFYNVGYQIKLPAVKQPQAIFLTSQQTRTTRRLDFLLSKLGEVFSLDNHRDSNLSIP
jgi:hypothetical protein